MSTRSRRRGNEDQRVHLTPGLIESYKRRINPKTGKKYTQSDIAKETGYSRQRISQVKYQTDRYTRTFREQAKDIFPFKVPRDPFMDSVPDKRLRDHGELMFAGVDELDPEKRRRLRSFYSMLRRDNLIVVFDLDNPPSPGIGQGGYAYVPRTTDDGDFLVRFNEDCELTEEERLLWRFPPVDL